MSSLNFTSEHPQIIMQFDERSEHDIASQQVLLSCEFVNYYSGWTTTTTTTTAAAAAAAAAVAGDNEWSMSTEAAHRQTRYIIDNFLFIYHLLLFYYENSTY